MTEEQARDWLRERFGSAAFANLARFADLLLAEAAQQSLIARSTFPDLWNRHIADSAQLVTLAPPDGTWLDVGSGGGLPGVVVAILRRAPLIMVEPRRKRVAFLEAVCRNLGLDHAQVIHGKVQSVAASAQVISARAVASLDDLFAWTVRNVSRETHFLLPRGERALTDLALARRAWHGSFHVEQSLTDPAAGIVVATGVRPR